MKPRAWIQTLTVSALCAAIVWALSPLITGHREPWDATNHYYLLALAVAGFVSGVSSPRVIWAYVVGSIVGQLLYELIFLAAGPLVVVGILFMCIYGLAFLAAALLGSYLRWRVLAVIQKS